MADLASCRDFGRLHAGHARTTDHERCGGSAGGAERIQTVKTLVLRGRRQQRQSRTGHDARRPRARRSKSPTTGARSTSEPGGSAWSRPAPRISPTSRASRPQKQVFGVDGDVAYNVAANGTATRAANAVANERRAEIYHHPLTIVRAALDPAAMLSNPAHAGERKRASTSRPPAASIYPRDRHHDQAADARRLDDRQHQPRRCGVETSFADYQDVSGLKLPARLTTKTDQYHHRRTTHLKRRPSTATLGISRRRPRRLLPLPRPASSQ